MLDFIKENHVSYCIVHKVDRLARNRVDDVEINVALSRAGVKLVSATENIDETPSGMLLHGIMSQVTYAGVTYDGAHEQIIEQATWDKVQAVLSAHNTAGDRQRAHEHYLKGSLFCGDCGSRLMINHATNAAGLQYDYFVCLGRHQKRTNCTRSAMVIEAVEQSVERAWQKLRLTYFERTQVEALIREQFRELSQRQKTEGEQLERQR